MKNMLIHENNINGGTLITNFDKQKVFKYIVAIQLFAAENPNHGLVISHKAYNKRKEPIESCYSLHMVENSEREHDDLSEFWNIYDSIKHDNY